jgi:hypothetical protein
VELCKDGHDHENGVAEICEPEFVLLPIHYGVNSRIDGELAHGKTKVMWPCTLC